MPSLNVGGTDLIRVLSARVQIDHGEDAKEAKQYPICQFVIELPLDDNPALAQWALAPMGDDRYKKVVLKTMDRSNKVNHTWTIPKGYVHAYHEIEFAPGSGSETDQGNYYRVVVRGVLAHDGQTYDGKNVLQVDKGDKETLPG